MTLSDGNDAGVVIAGVVEELEVATVDVFLPTVVVVNGEISAPAFVVVTDDGIEVFFVYSEEYDDDTLEVLDDVVISGSFVVGVCVVIDVAAEELLSFNVVLTAVGVVLPAVSVCFCLLVYGDSVSAVITYGLVATEPSVGGSFDDVVTVGAVDGCDGVVGDIDGVANAGISDVDAGTDVVLGDVADVDGFRDAAGGGEFGNVVDVDGFGDASGGGGFGDVILFVLKYVGDADNVVDSVTLSGGGVVVVVVDDDNDDDDEDDLNVLKAMVEDEPGVVKSGFNFVVK